MLNTKRPMSTGADYQSLDLEGAELLARVQGGQTWALAALYDRYGPSAFHLAHHILGKAAAAEDVVQEVFLEIWSQPANAATLPTSVRAWILRTVRLRCRARQESVLSHVPWSTTENGLGSSRDAGLLFHSGS